MTQLKNMPQLRLHDLLRRRKTTLIRFLEESGIVNYVGLVTKCNDIGVAPPSEEEYAATCPPTVSSPADGVIVIAPVEVEQVEESVEASRRRRKKQIVDTTENDS